MVDESEFPAFKPQFIIVFGSLELHEVNGNRTGPLLVPW
jgi:hypothetical protein